MRRPRRDVAHGARASAPAPRDVCVASRPRRDVAPPTTYRPLRSVVALR
ncbi:hypothetical protein STTU_1609 [Streptomyces sp. Tu6071]|nr:hypothetical protein STTU_1609 [Streptomyces sp. Tu6071]